MQVTVFVICILSRRSHLIQVSNARARPGSVPTALYVGPCPPTPDQCVHRLVDKLVFADKWITSEATHMLVTLTNGVRVWQGKKKRKELSAGRKRGGRGCGGQMGHAEGVDFQVGPAGHVWPNRKWQGAFEGPWHWTLKPGCCAPSSASKPRHSSHSPWSSSRGTSARALCEASVGTSRQCSTSEVSQLSAIPCRSGAGARASPGAPAERADRLCPFVPGLPRHLRDCIDLSWFHSARGPTGFQVSNICHTEVASCWVIQSGDKSAQNCLWICNKNCMDFFFFFFFFI